MLIEVWCCDLRERAYLEDLEYKEWYGEAWTGLIWLRTGTGGGFVVNAILNVRVPS